MMSAHGWYSASDRARLMSDDSNFEGHDPRECGEHRTVGPHRAWCYDCREWCYPDSPCKGCELPQLRAQVARLAGKG